MSARLVSLDGRADIPLDRVLTVVGRHRLCDARLDSGRISRRHCCLAIDRDGVLVRDLGSTNGTRINGHRVDVGLLRPGDELWLATARFRLEIQESGTPYSADRRDPAMTTLPAPPTQDGMLTRLEL
jgi:pSer/pThr/pTyr-binding forkhead associated (FHA) protein